MSIAYVRKENKDLYEEILLLRDESGGHALTPAHKRILEYVASFDPKKACYASNDTINRNTITARSPKTLARHIEYLLEIGALSSRREGIKRFLTLSRPRGPVVVSQKQFRHRKGMREYAYMNTDNPEVKAKALVILSKEVEDAVDASVFFFEDDKNFSSNEENFASDEGQILPEMEANFAPILDKEKKEDLQQLTQKNIPPFFPPQSCNGEFIDASCWDEEPSEVLVLTSASQGEHELAAQAPGVGQTAGRPLADGALRRQDGGFFCEAENEKKDKSEPLVTPKKRGQGKRMSQQERRAEANRRINKGHLVNPLGMADNRPRRLNPLLAKDCPQEKITTVPQLYRFLLKKYGEAFGEGMLEGMMPDDKSAIQAKFSSLGQKFIDSCGYDPTKADLAQYFAWFLEPSRLTGLLKAGKYNGKNQIVAWEQMTGAVFVRKFFDEVIKRRVKGQAETPSSKLSGGRDIASEIPIVAEAYKQFQGSECNNALLVITACSFGYQLFGQYLHEEKGVSEEDLFDHVLGIMTRFVSEASDKAMAEETLREIEEKSSLNIASCDARCVWYDWRSKCGGLVDKAIEAAIKAKR